MFLGSLFGRRGGKCVEGSSARAKAMRNAVASAVESLEPRQMFSVDTFSVGSTTTLVTLQAVNVSGTMKIEGFENGSSTPSYVSSASTTGIIVSATGATATFKDLVPAATKPSGGISFNVPDGSTLELDTAANDKTVQLGATSASSGTIAVTDPTAGVTRSDSYTGALANITVAAAGSGVSFKDAIPAAYKPSGGVHFSSGSGSSLEVDAGVNDHQIQLASATASAGEIDVTDPTVGASGTTTGKDFYGIGITQLVLRTSDVVASDYYVPGSYTSGQGSEVDVQKGLADSIGLTINTGAGTYDTLNLGNNETPSTGDIVVNTGAGHDRVIASQDNDNDLHLHITADFGSGTGTGDGLGLDNSLFVGAEAWVFLKDNAGDGHTVVLDSTTVDPYGELFVDQKSTLGSLDVRFDANTLPGEVFFRAAGSAVGPMTLDGNAFVEASTTISSLVDGDNTNGLMVFTGAPGASVIDSANFDGSLSVNNGGSATVNSLVSDGTLTVQSGGGVTVNSLLGGGTVTVHSGGTAVFGSVDQSGTVTVETGATMTVGTVGGSTTSNFALINEDGNLTLHVPTTIGDLEQTGGKTSLGQAGTWRDHPLNNTVTTLNISGGLVDVGDQDLLVTGTSQSTITGYLTSGYTTSGNWQGTTGITSAEAIGNPNRYSIGYTDETYNSTTGLSLSGTETLVRPTTAGDIDLNGTTDFNDFLVLQTNYGSSPTVWCQGNLDYDHLNKTDFNDFLVLQRAYGYSFPT